jgi:alpha-L-fucosidase
VTAFRRRGLRVGLYYSLIDWYHPAFGVDAFHPQYDPTLPERLGGGSRDEYRAYLHGQVRELVQAFQPDVLWFDFSYPDGSSWSYPSRIGELPGRGAPDWGSAELVQMVRELQPEILINDRLDLPASADFVTPEEVVPEVSEAKYGSGVLRESCRTLNGSWGYAPSFQSWLDAGQVVRLLVDSVSRGDNLLLNVGPTARGQIEPKARRLLAEVGDWMDDHGAAVHGAEAGDLPAPRDCRITKSGDRRFLHVFAWPSGQLALSGLPGELEFACFVHDGAEVELTTLPAAEMVVLKLPVRQPDVAVPVIELFFRGS